MLLDPGTWLDRAAHAHEPARRHELVSVAHGLERLDLWASTQAMSHRIENDYLMLRDAWPDAPHMLGREILLHALASPTSPPGTAPRATRSAIRCSVSTSPPHWRN